MTGAAAANQAFGVLDWLDSGAVVLDRERRVLHWNRWMERTSGVAAASLLGRPIERALANPGGTRLEEAIEDALEKGMSSVLTGALNGALFPLKCADGRPLAHNVAVGAMEDADGRRCVLQIQDVTAHRHAETTLRALGARARLQLAEVETLYRTAPIGLGLFDRDMRFLRVNEALAEINGPPVEEHLGRVAWEVVPTLRAASEPLFQRVFETGEPLRGVEIHGTTPRAPGVERDWVEDLYPLKGPDGAVVAVGVIVREVTEQRRQEERERLLKAELHHRIKNLFTMVGALARQSAGGEPGVEGFMERFEGRLLALGAAQELLDAGAEPGAIPLPELTRAALKPFDGADGRLRQEVEAVPVPSDMASDLVLALHELATNATKYGALSGETGRVALTGALAATPDGPVLRLEWRESDGPTVRRPERKGFGTRLLERVIALRWGGEVVMDWRETGLVCRIELPRPN